VDQSWRSRLNPSSLRVRVQDGGCWGGGEVQRIHTNRWATQRGLIGRCRTGADLVGDKEIEIVSCVGWRSVDCSAENQGALLRRDAL
jgi:hypothetical protein